MMQERLLVGLRFFGSLSGGDDVFAFRLAFRFVGRTRDVDVQLERDFRVQPDGTAGACTAAPSRHAPLRS